MGTQNIDFNNVLTSNLDGANLSKIIFNSTTAWEYIAPSGSQTFTSSSTFTVPAGVTSVRVRIVGGGGNGGGDASYSANRQSNNYYSYGGKRGEYKEQMVNVTPGQSITVTVGGAGQTTSFGAVTASGGASNTHSGNNGLYTSPMNGAAFRDGVRYHWTYTQNYYDSGCCCTATTTDNRYNYGGQASAFGDGGDATGGQGKNGSVGAGGSAGGGIGGRGECQVAWGSEISEEEVFTSSGTFVVPAGVTSIRARMTGGGGNGGGVAVNYTMSGGLKIYNSVVSAHYSYGGKRGEYKDQTFSVTPGQSISVTIGGAGQSTSFNGTTAAGGASNTHSGDNGAYTSPYDSSTLRDGTKYYWLAEDVAANSRCCCDAGVDDQIHHYGGQASAFGNGGDGSGGQGKNGGIGAGGAAGGGIGGRGECRISWST